LTGSDARGISYAADGSIIGIELLSPRRKGVLLDGLPFPDDVERVMRAVGFRSCAPLPERRPDGSGTVPDAPAPEFATA